jgi:hypothetical protein
MPRGTTSKVGDVMINALGYSQTRTEQGWRPTSHLVAEEKLGRGLREDEVVRFADNDRTNLDPSNITIHLKGPRKSRAAMIARLTARIADLQAELELLLKEEAAES